MPALKKTNQNNKKQAKMAIIAICVIILVLIPLSIWLLGFNSKTANLTKYKSDSYTFYYPKNWTLTKSPMQDLDGTSYYLAPEDATQPKSSHVSVEVAPANDNSIKAMDTAFRIFNYTQSSATVDGINAQKYTETIHSTEGTLHSIAYIVVTNKNVYLIQLGYKQDITDSQLEDQFNQIVTTFSTH